MDSIIYKSLLWSVSPYC